MWDTEGHSGCMKRRVTDLSNGAKFLGGKRHNSFCYFEAVGIYPLAPPSTLLQVCFRSSGASSTDTQRLPGGLLQIQCHIFFLASCYDIVAEPTGVVVREVAFLSIRGVFAWCLIGLRTTIADMYSNGCESWLFVSLLDFDISWATSASFRDVVYSIDSDD